MDFSQVLIPVVVLAPLIVFILFVAKRGTARKPAISIMEPSAVPRRPHPELTVSRSTTVAREITLSAKYEGRLARLLNDRGWKGAICQLPALPAFFVGRRNELARALTLLDVAAPPRALAITSAREFTGVGVSGFVTVLGHLLAERLPDAQVYIDLEKAGGADASSGVVEAMSHAVRALNRITPIPKDLAELPALYQKSLEGRRILLVVENVRPQPYLELLRPPAGSLLLLTSHEPIAFARIDTIALEPLSRPDGRAFLRATNSRMNRETDTHLDLLAELSGHLPEALRLNASRLQANPAQSIDWHFAQLKKADAFKRPLDAARALSGISAAPDAVVPLPVVQTPLPNGAARESDPEVWKSKRAFVQRFQSRSESDFSLTDLPAPFADPSCGPAPDYPDALRFLADFPEGSGDDPAVAGLEAAVSAARALKDPRAEISALAMLGKARAKSGEPRLAVACFERWVEFARESRDQRAEAEALGWLGVGWIGAGFADRGTGCFEAQLRIAREVGDRGSELVALGKLGQARAILGDFQSTAGLYGQELIIAREMGDRVAELDALENLGIAHSRLKDVEKAAHFHEEQLTAARAARDASSESRALGYLGQVAMHRGKIEDAVVRYEEQLDLAVRNGDFATLSHAHASLGVAWARQGDLRKAVTHYGQQLRIAQQMRNHPGEASAHSNIGSGLERLGDLTGAAAAWERALAIYESLGSPSADTMRRWLERVRAAQTGGGQG